MATFEEMRAKHRKDSMLTLSLFLFLLLIFVFDTEYADGVREVIRKRDNLAEALKKSWTALVLTLVGPFAGYFIGILTIAKRDLYYPVDDAIFKRRRNVDRYICQKMLSFGIRLTNKDQQSLHALAGRIGEPAKRKGVMSLFYRYIEKEDVVNPELKRQAFVYWGDYFSSMMFAVWGATVLVGAILIMVCEWSATLLRLVVIAIMVALIGVNLREILVGKTAKKQFAIPETQIREIHRNPGRDLLADLRAEGFFLSHD
jgi:hypothetical protein